MADYTFNLKTLKVGAADAIPVTAHTFRSFLGRWRAPTFKHGEFDVYVSVGKVDGTPVYELPLPNDDGQRRYKIGRIRLVESLPPAPESSATADATMQFVEISSTTSMR